MGREDQPWAVLENEELLDWRLCDLALSIDGSWLEEPIRRVHDELAMRGIKMRPHFWLSDEWFCPDGVPGVALPFFLAHERLMRLERAQMLEVEGGTKEECIKLLRHEVGHAIDHAYLLHRQRDWQATFGKSSEPYPDYYRPNPASKNFVQHLDAWYAQSHPDEDFAETFAVWLRPRSSWRRRYQDWPALKKLEYVDQVMTKLRNAKPAVSNRERPHSLSRIRKTLRAYYQEKRERYLVGYSDVYDRDLLRLFSPKADLPGAESAAAFVKRNRAEIRELVARWTGEYQFTLDQVLNEMIGRARSLKLKVNSAERKLKLDFAILLTVHTMHCLYGGREWHAL